MSDKEGESEMAYERRGRYQVRNVKREYDKT